MTRRAWVTLGVFVAAGTAALTAMVVNPESASAKRKKQEPPEQAPVKSPEESSAASSAADIAELQNCFGQLKGLRLRMTAQMLEARLASADNLSAKDRKEWEEDIAALKEADELGMEMPNSPPDSHQPLRYLTHLDTDDRKAIDEQYATFSQQQTDKCVAKAKAGPKLTDPSKR